MGPKDSARTAIRSGCSRASCTGSSDSTGRLSMRLRGHADGSPDGLQWRASLAALAAAVALVQPFGAAAIQQPPAFSSAARTVAVYATVMNAEHRLVTDLGRDQFTVEDTGKRQE